VQLSRSLAGAAGRCLDSGECAELKTRPARVVDSDLELPYGVADR